MFTAALSILPLEITEAKMFNTNVVDNTAEGARLTSRSRLGTFPYLLARIS